EIINNHNDNQEEIIPFKMLTSKLYDEVCNIAPNIYMENENTGIEFSCLLELKATDDPHKLSKKIVELVEQGDRYTYI
ncbi:1991_t:CDS:1, partial [Racocetra persica]